jgi:hypothetical protein
VAVGGSTTLRNQTDSTTAFQIQNSAGSSILNVDSTSRNVGIGTSTPDRRLDILDASNPQLRLTYTDGSVYTDLQTTSDGYLNIIPSGNRITVGTSDTTGTLLVLDTKTGSGDPTGVDGAMYYNSNYKTFRCYENSAWVDCRGSNIGWTELSDEFIAGQVGGVSTNIGDLGWTATVNNGNISYVAGVANHPGIRNVATTTSSGTIQSLRMSSSNSNLEFVRGDVDSLVAIIRPQTISAAEIRFGLFNNSQVAPASEMIAFQYDTTNWETVTCVSTCSGADLTETDTGTAASSNTWYKLEIRGISTSSITFYLNDTLVATHTTDIPATTQGMVPAFQIQTNSAAAKDVDVDFFQLRSVRYGSRF